MSYISKNLNCLKLLSCCSKKKKDEFIKKGDKTLIRVLNECVINTLNGKIKLDNKTKNKLLKYKYPLRKLVKRKKISDKKKILIQEGGFLQYILPEAITLLTSLIHNLIKNKK